MFYFRLMSHIQRTYKDKTDIRITVKIKIKKCSKSAITKLSYAKWTMLNGKLSETNKKNWNNNAYFQTK